MSAPFAWAWAIIRRELGFRYQTPAYENNAFDLWRSQKSEPGRPGSLVAHPIGGGSGRAVIPLARRHQHGIDHMDDAVRLVDVGDRDHGAAALGVDDPDLAAVFLHC